MRPGFFLRAPAFGREPVGSDLYLGTLAKDGETSGLHLSWSARDGGMLGLKCSTFSRHSGMSGDVPEYVLDVVGYVRRCTRVHLKCT